MFAGLRFGETFGPIAYAVKLPVEILRDLGPALNPFAAFLLLQGLETLSLRVQRHCDNALALANWLEQHSKMAPVYYPGLPSYKLYALALCLLWPGALGRDLRFGVKGDGAAVGSQVVDKLKPPSNLANVYDAKTLVIHPATTTHEQLTTEEQFASGATLDFIRVSGGSERQASYELRRLRITSPSASKPSWTSSRIELSKPFKLAIPDKNTSQ